MRPLGFCGLISSWRGCEEVSQGVVQYARVGKAPGRYCAYGSFVWEWGQWYRNFWGAGFGGCVDNSCPPIVDRLGLDPGYLAIFIYPILWPLTPTIAVVSAVWRTLT